MLLLPLWKPASVAPWCVCFESIPFWRGLTDYRPVSPREDLLTRYKNRKNCLTRLAIAG
jgi:hypothetical protein